MSKMKILTKNTCLRTDCRVQNSTPGIVWFIVICIVIYAFFCTYRNMNFGLVASPLKVGCYK